MATTTLPVRSDVPQEETWNLESIFPDLGSGKKPIKRWKIDSLNWMFIKGN